MLTVKTTESVCILLHSGDVLRGEVVETVGDSFTIFHEKAGKDRGLKKSDVLMLINECSPEKSYFRYGVKP